MLYLLLDDLSGTGRRSLRSMRKERGALASPHLHRGPNRPFQALTVCISEIVVLLCELNISLCRSERRRGYASRSQPQLGSPVTPWHDGRASGSGTSSSSHGSACCCALLVLRCRWCNCCTVLRHAFDGRIGGGATRPVRGLGGMYGGCQRSGGRSSAIDEVRRGKREGPLGVQQESCATIVQKGRKEGSKRSQASSISRKWTS